MPCSQIKVVLDVLKLRYRRRDINSYNSNVGYATGNDLFVGFCLVYPVFIFRID